MERNFSVDDIVGTLWKLDTNNSSNHGSSRSSDPAADLAAFGLGLDEVFKRIPRVDSHWVFQDYFKLHDSAKAKGSDTVLRRNESMWALQEFLKDYDLIEAANTGGQGPASTAKADHADDRCALDLNASPSNKPAQQLDCALNSSLNVWDGIARNVDDDCSNLADDKDRQNTEFGGIHSANEGPSNKTAQQLDCVLNSSLNVWDGIARNVDDDCKNLADDKDRQNTEFGGIHSATEGSNGNDLMTVAVCDRQFAQRNTSRPSYRLLDSALFSNLFQASEFQDVSTSISSQPHSLELSSSDSFHAKEFQEQQVSGALNPLFTGLQNVLPNVSKANAQEYEMMLKRQLDLACAAVASKRAQQRPGSSDAHASSSAVLKVKTETVDATEYGDRKVSAPLGIPALPPKPKGALSDTPRINTSGSSGEHSDDEADVESGAAGQVATPDDIKKLRRMLSNRESARRSRRRKQAHLNDLEIQVAQMRAENASLFKQLTEISQKLNSALVDNHVLKLDVNELRSKIEMAEDLLAKSTAPAVRIGTKNEAATPLILQCGMAEEPQNVGGKMGRTPSMQRIASLEHLQKKIRGGVSPLSWGTTWWEEGPMEDQGSSEKE